MSMIVRPNKRLLEALGTMPIETKTILIIMIPTPISNLDL